MLRSLSLDLTAEIAIIDAGQSVDVVVDAAVRSEVNDTDSEPAWNNTPSCLRTQQHVMRHRPSQGFVTFPVDDVISGDRVGALANLPRRRNGVERAQGLREMLSELLIRSALTGDMEVVSGLLSCQYVHVDVADRRGNTALHCASVSHSVHTVPLFLLLITIFFLGGIGVSHLCPKNILTVPKKAAHLNLTNYAVNKLKLFKLLIIYI